MQRYTEDKKDQELIAQYQTKIKALKKEIRTTSKALKKDPKNKSLQLNKKELEQEFQRLSELARLTKQTLHKRKNANDWNRSLMSETYDETRK